MRLSVISFTKQGMALSERIAACAEEKMQVRLFTKCSAFLAENEAGNPSVLFVEDALEVWAGRQMDAGHALLFVGACGIAVRAVAPHLKDKLHDSPVLVMDEKGRYVIPLLAGHVGGANEIASFLAKRMGASPVITTATDINGKFAVDVFAGKNGLFIADKEGIAKVSAKALLGETITISIETGHGPDTEPPAGVAVVDYPPAGRVDVVVTSEKRHFDATLVLRARDYVIGLGCKKGKPEAAIADFIADKLGELCVDATQIYALVSVGLKREEEGILAWCRKEGVPFFTYSAQELRKVQGNFCRSAFVEEKTGVDNVCERAAVRACGDGGRLIAGKQAKDGMTLAVAKRKWSVCFEKA